MSVFNVGDKVVVRDNRKGTFRGTVTKAFDSEQDEWYSISLRQDCLEGMSTRWENGDSVPCRRGISRVELDKEV